MKNYIAYYRVSTQKQGVSGLGLESQKSTVINFIGANGNLVAEFTEIESGKNDNRIELKKALEMAKETGSTLIIAKLDRLSRNVAFIFQLRDSKADFICCDMPDANTMTIGIFALLAQQERELISERTKKALQAKKARGEKLGSPKNMTDSARNKSIQIRKAKADTNENNKKAFALIESMRKNGDSYNTIANKLNECGFLTATGKHFNSIQVQRIEKRFSSIIA